MSSLLTPGILQQGVNPKATFLSLFPLFERAYGSFRAMGEVEDPKITIVRASDWQEIALSLSEYQDDTILQNHINNGFHYLRAIDSHIPGLSSAERTNNSTIFIPRISENGIMSEDLAGVNCPRADAASAIAYDSISFNSTEDLTIHAVISTGRAYIVNSGNSGFRLNSNRIEVIAGGSFYKFLNFDNIALGTGNNKLAHFLICRTGGILSLFINGSLQYVDGSSDLEAWDFSATLQDVTSGTNYNSEIAIARGSYYDQAFEIYTQTANEYGNIF